MSQLVKTPILIVGGGPVGLCLALDFSWRDIPCVLIERGDGTIHHPKTGALSSRTMEFFRRWGVAEKVRKCGFAEDYHLNMVFCTSMTGPLLGIHRYPSAREEPQPSYSPEKKQRASQLFVDPILASEVRERRCVDVRYHNELIEFEERDESVIAHVRDHESGDNITIETQFLIGCDGAGSLVRQQLGIEMKGDPLLDYSVAIFIRSPELVHRHDKGEAERYIFLGPEGTWGNLTAVDGKELWRLTVLGSKEKIEMNSFDGHAWLRRCMGADSISFDILSVQPWRRSRLVAERYGSRRVFLAGDSAHTMSPTGGFGFNTGLGDAMDIAWKLDATLRGWAGPRLLASYEAERRPIGVRNSNQATTNYFQFVSPTNCAKILDASAEGEAARSRIGAHILEATRTEWETVGVTHGYRYENSPICIDDDGAEPVDDPTRYQPTSFAGHHAPHAWLSPGHSTLDLFGKGYVLFLFHGAPDPEALVRAAAERNVPLTVIKIADPNVAQLYERKCVLVRPDGHNAWRDDSMPADALAVIDRVRGACP